MRKHLLFISFFISFRLLAQTNVYRPFPEDSALWIVDWTQQNNNPVRRDLYIMNGDTLINGLSYNKLYIERNIYKGPFTPPTVLSPYTYLGAIRQDIINKKVYFRNTSMTSDTLLYNFNLKVGDTLPKTYLITNMGSGPVIVTSIKDTIRDGIRYKRFRFNKSSIYGHLIEGIGSDCGPFGMSAHWEGGPTLTCFKTHKLSASYHWGLYAPCGYYNFPTGIYSKEKNNSIVELYPNPSTGVFTVISFEKIQFSVYDVFGREVLPPVNSFSQLTTLDLSSSPKGIYFVKIRTNEKTVIRKIILK